MSCPDANALLDFAAGRATGAQRDALEHHLDGCGSCRDLVADLFSVADRGPVGPPVLRPGDRIGRFVVRECLGRGGMGVVHSAFDERLGRVVAIKLLHREAQGGTARLVREAQAIARVSHENVVKVFGTGVLDDVRDTVFIVMERIDGTTLREWLATRRPLAEILAVFRGAAAGLAAAHAHGIVHRDFKPDNVMIDRAGVAKVMDFGLARLGGTRVEQGATLDAEADDRLTWTGTLVGTPAYMAPEQLTDGVADPRSDQYAFCIALFEAVCGVRPFAQRDSDDLFAAKRSARVEFPASSAVPAWLRRVLLRGLASDPDERFVTMEDVQRALEPPRRRLLVVAALAVGTTIVALGSRGASETREGCDAAGSLDAVGWGVDDRDALDRALRRGLPTDATAKALAGIDAWTQGWVGAHALACANGDDRELACLAARRAGLAAVLELVRDASSTATARPTDVLARLGDPRDCVDAPDGRLDEHTEVALARVRTLADLGELQQAREESEVAVARAREGGDVPAIARLSLEQAAVLEDLDAWSEAMAAVEEAHHRAEQAGDDATAARAAIRGVSLLSKWKPERRAVQTWLRHAETAVQRAGTSIELATGLAIVRARALELEGDLAGARAQLEHAAGEAERGDDEGLHVVLSNLGVVMGKSGDLAAAIEVFERDRRLVLERYGADHPALVEVDVNLSAAHVNNGELAEGLAVLERARALEEALPTPRPTRLGNIWLNRAIIEYRGGRWTQAMAAFERAAELFERGYVSGHPAHGRALYGVALSLQNAGREADAETKLREVVEVFETAMGTEYRELVGPLDALADLAAERGEPVEALALRRRALAIAERTLPSDDPETADVRAGLGSDLVASGDLDAAVDQLERALSVLRRPEARALGYQPAVACLPLGRARMQQGRAKDAAQLLESCVADLPDEADEELRREATALLADAQRRR